MSTLKELEIIKKKAVEEILNNPKFSKLEKLTLIHENNLWGVDQFIHHISNEWRQECIDLERKQALASGLTEDDYICGIVDDYFNSMDFEKHETVYYVNEIEYLLEDIEESASDEGIDVVTCRGDFNSTVHKSTQEFIDKICDYCFENEIVGYINDW